MSSSVQRKRIRKDPAARRAEIVDTAAAIALAEGLECITLRRIAEELAVRPGLISHYFPSAEELVAEAFGSAATGELDRLLPAGPHEDRPVERLARFLDHTSGEAYDAISRLWLNARHLSRYRPPLRDRVVLQETDWRGRLEGLIQDGVTAGEFRTGEPLAVALRLLVVLDGLSVDVNTAGAAGPELPAAVHRMTYRTAERELGLAEGALERIASAG
ncbi:TetR family transcriptional regulator C-terminal domain-containing protein [Streptomyces sp. NPDC047813]|uniref:TetR/AcrR family transcriptional regulator n=1 Tax=Streptomyces sp. NPDC047813 TaxID=3154608 RepID=UPI00340E09B0